MSVALKCPELLPTLVVAGDAYLAAQLSSVLAESGCYLPVVDGPRMTRPDRNAEVQRRHNAAARVRAKQVILAGLEAEELAGMEASLPTARVVKVQDWEDVHLVAEQGRLGADPLRWGRERVGVGLLKALRERRPLEFTSDPSPDDVIASRSGHLVVCEEGELLTEVIAANYAYALGAGLRMIPAVSRHKAQEILQAYYGLYDQQDVPTAELLEEMGRQLRGLCPDVSAPDHGSMTFVTGDLPYGIAFPEVPTTHLQKYPDLGITIVNGFAAEQKDAPGLSMAVLVDPGATPAPEIEKVRQQLVAKGVLVREYRSGGASVASVSMMVEYLPYDLLVFATHCGDDEGYRWTYQYRDSEGRDRTLVVDIAIGVAQTRDENMLRVTQFVRFHSLDGVLWDDPNREAKLDVGTAILDWERLTHTESVLEPTIKETIPRVKGSASLRMADHNYLSLPASLAGNGTPIVISNACVSWHELSGRFMFAGARAYVGTLYPVTTSEAEAVIRPLFDKQFGKFLPHALWSSQNAAYRGHARRPYVATGVYTQRLRPPRHDAPTYVLARLMSAQTAWERHVARAAGANDPDRAKRVSEVTEYFKEEAHSFRRRLFARP